MHLMYLSVVGVFVVLIRELYELIIRITMEARDADFMDLKDLGVWQSGSRDAGFRRILE